MLQSGFFTKWLLLPLWGNKFWSGKQLFMVYDMDEWMKVCLALRYVPYILFVLATISNPVICILCLHFWGIFWLLGDYMVLLCESYLNLKFWVLFMPWFRKHTQYLNRNIPRLPSWFSETVSSAGFLTNKLFCRLWDAWAVFLTVRSSPERCKHFGLPGSKICSGAVRWSHLK